MSDLLIVLPFLGQGSGSAWFLCFLAETFKIYGHSGGGGAHLTGLKLNLKHQTRKRIHRLGNKSATRPRTVAIKFLNYKDHLVIWNQRRLLKGSRLYLEEHFALEIQQSRTQLLPFLQVARQRGEKASLVVDKLWVGGQRFSATEGDLRSLQLRYGETKDKSEQEIQTEEGLAVCFYGCHSVFSNFYLTPMKVSGRKFARNEHFYTVRKCKMSGRPDLAE